MRVFPSLLAIAVCVSAAFLSAAADGPASAPAMDPWVQDLQKRLSSADAGERDAAKKELAAIASIWQQPEMMQKLAESTDDLELKNLFLQRADLVKSRQAEKDAMNLPPISLSVKNAGFPELAEALNTALDTDMVKGSQNSGISGSFTLEVKNKPFWEVFQMLQEQTPFAVQNNGSGWGFYNNGAGIRNYAVNGPAMLWPMNGSFRRSLNLQTTEAAQTNLNITLGVIIDPRMSVSRLTNFRVISATDELGHHLERPGLNPGTQYMQNNITNLSASLQSVEGLGKLATLVCEMRAGVGTAFVEATQDDIQKNLTKDIPIGNRMVRINNLTITPTQINLGGSINQSQPVPPGTDPNIMIQYRILDANGKSVWSYSSPGGFSNSMQLTTPTTGPYRLVARMATKIEDINLHFELKDVPLP